MRLHTLTLAILVAFATLTGCEGTKTVRTVQPAYGDPCEFVECAPGVCRPTSATAHECLCPLGYTGPICGNCEPDFHRDSLDRCVSDKRCSEQPGDPCGVGGTCVEDTGVLSCVCDEGYEGPRCSLCADRYARDDVGRCLPLFLVEGGVGAPTQPAAMSCPPGYSGADCKTCSPGYHKNVDSCVVDDVCKPTSCPPNGLCTVVAGIVECACETGYSGPSCARCAAGSHREEDVCVPDQVCAADSCPAQAACAVVKGRIECTCMAGYQGSGCTTCAAGYRKQGDACVADSGSCPAGQHATDGGACMPDPWCEQSSCPEHATCAVVAGNVTCPCDPGWGPAGACDTCDRYATERSGFEFPVGWPPQPNQCATRGELSVSLITFRSRTGPDGKPDGVVYMCSPSSYAKMATQHIELQAYRDRPATLVFERPAILVAFDFGARIEPLALDVYAFDNPTTDMSVGGRAVGTIDLEASMRSTFTIPLNPRARAIALRSRSGKLQDIALDDLIFSYAECE